MMLLSWLVMQLAILDLRTLHYSYATWDQYMETKQSQVTTSAFGKSH